MWILLIITSIGYNPVNISQILLSEIRSQKEHLYLSDNDAISTTQHTPDRSWMLTEPLGGLAGGIVSGIIGGISGMLVFSAIDDFDAAGFIGAQIGGHIGYPIGTGLGIWATGKYIEKESGSWATAILGSIGEGIGYYKCREITTGSSAVSGDTFAVSLLCGLICYCLSL